MATTTAETGTYSDGSAVRIIGRRNGFIYITFLDGAHKGITTKVPPSWVTPAAGDEVR